MALRKNRFIKTVRKRRRMRENFSWGELANFTHTKQVEEFNFCLCEEQEQFPYEDCPREEK